MTSIPSHLREDIFRSYEPLIATAVKAFPNETSFTIPPNVAPSTFIARFRDAILSLKNFRWPTSSIDVDKLWKLSAERAYALRLENDSDGRPLVWFRPRRPAGRPNLMVSQAREHVAEAAAASVVPLRDMTDGQLQALCILIDGKVLTGMYTTPTVFPDATIADLTATFDVGITRDVVNNLTIIA